MNFDEQNSTHGMDLLRQARLSLCSVANGCRRGGLPFIASENSIRGYNTPHLSILPQRDIWGHLVWDCLAMQDILVCVSWASA